MKDKIEVYRNEYYNCIDCLGVLIMNRKNGSMQCNNENCTMEGIRLKIPTIEVEILDKELINE